MLQILRKIDLELLKGVSAKTEITIVVFICNRAKQCSLGQNDAKDGQDCVSLPGIAGGYRKVR